MADTHDQTTANLYRNLGADEAVIFLSDPERVLDLYGLAEEEEA